MKEWMSGPLGLRGTRAGEGVLIHFAAACALSVGVNFDEQQEDAQSERERETDEETGRRGDRGADRRGDRQTDSQAGSDAQPKVAPSNKFDYKMQQL